jgi:hypothetical protein
MGANSAPLTSRLEFAGENCLYTFEEAFDTRTSLKTLGNIRFDMFGWRASILPGLGNGYGADRKAITPKQKTRLDQIRKANFTPADHQTAKFESSSVSRVLAQVGRWNTKDRGIARWSQVRFRHPGAEKAQVPR